MNDKYVVWTNIKDKKFPLCLNIGAADVLENEFGSIDAVAESVTAHAQKNELGEMMRVILAALRPLAEFGKVYLTESALFSGEDPEKIEDLPADDVLQAILSGTEIVELWADVALALRGGSSREVEVAPDNNPKNGETAM